MTIAPYEQMKNYIDNFKNRGWMNHNLYFKMRYYANSIDIMESWGYRDIQSYEILITQSQANNFTEYTYNQLLEKLLVKLKMNEINKKLDEIKKDF